MEPCCALSARNLIPVEMIHSASSTSAVAFTLLHLLKVAGLPTLLDRGLGRAIQPKDGEIPLARHGRHPVAGLTLRRFGTEVEIRAAVVVLRRLISRPSEGNGWPLASPEAFSASYRVTDQKFAAGMLAGRFRR